MINSFKCPKCLSIANITSSINVVSFGCNKCNSLFSKNQFTGILDFQKHFPYNPINRILQIGIKGVFEGETYEVIGYLIKKTEGIFYLREYTLKSTQGNFLYLSEVDGHWIVLTELEEELKMDNHGIDFEYEDLVYNKYGTTTSTIVGAYGFFDIKIPLQNTKTLEYINPPFILSKEFLGDKMHFYKGRHISKKEIKKAFSLKQEDLPTSFGVGLLQPYWFNIKNTAILFCSTILLILMTHKIINSGRSEKQVLNTSIKFSDFHNKDYVSPSFELTGSAAPLRIDIASPVSNSWASAGISLINEVTNEEVFAEKDIEYYSGYEDGYAWNEGSTAEHFYICGVGPGKYHLSAKVSKNDLDYSTDAIHIRAKWEGASNWNFGFAIWTLLGLFALIYGGYYLFEKSRWSTSDFSPYETEEY